VGPSLHSLSAFLRKSSLERCLFRGVNLTDLAVVLLAGLLRLAISMSPRFMHLIFGYKPCFRVEVISEIGICR